MAANGVSSADVAALGEGERRAAAVDEATGHRTTAVVPAAWNVGDNMAALTAVGDVAAAAAVGGVKGGSGAAAANEATE